MAESIDDARFALLKLKLSELQAAIRSYDAAIQSVRGWAVTLTLGICVLATQSRSWGPAVFGVFCIGIFALVEGSIKDVQHVLVQHNGDIEHAIRSQGLETVVASDLALPSISLQFREARKRHEEQASALSKSEWPRFKWARASLLQLRRFWKNIRPATVQIAEAQTAAVYGSCCLLLVIAAIVMLILPAQVP